MRHEAEQFSFNFTVPVKSRRERIAEFINGQIKEREEKFLSLIKEADIDAEHYEAVLKLMYQAKELGERQCWEFNDFVNELD